MAKKPETPRRFLPPSQGIEEPYRLTPKLALRVGMLGMVAIGIFAVLFLRLWSLQILNGEQLLRAAQNNQRRDVRVQAPRGPILDRFGRKLVTNVPGTAVQIRQTDFPQRRGPRLREIRALGRLLDLPARQIGMTLRRHRNDPLTPVTIKEGVSELQVGYLKERAEDFPGVQVAGTYLRYYPHRELAAHVLGFVTEISALQLAGLRTQGYRAGDTIGQSGIEAKYDKYLRGTPGLAQLRVDSLGRPIGRVIPKVPPHPGNAVRLTIDLKLQMAAEQAVRYGIERAHNSECIGCWYSNGGAIVAIDPRDGAIRALASYPTYRPSLYVGRVRTRALDAAGLTARTAKSMNYPALDRATDAAYPPGSTFKPVTALAAMQEHLIQPYDTLAVHGVVREERPGLQELGPVRERGDDPADGPGALLRHLLLRPRLPLLRDAGRARPAPAGLGEPVRLRPAHRASTSGPRAPGLLPTPDWRKRTYTKKTDPCCWEIDRLWKPGDSIQLAIGQKDLLTTPMQMARFYAAIANGGKLVTPHLLLDVEQPPSNGRPGVVLPARVPKPAQPTNVDAQALQVVRDGLYQATHDSLGTSAAIFSGFPIPISGKTGTAEKEIDPGDGYRRLFNQSWWCGYGPSDNARLVVCALIENGGHGGDAAAPAALKVFEQFFGKEAVQRGPIHSD